MNGHHHHTEVRLCCLRRACLSLLLLLERERERAIHVYLACWKLNGGVVMMVMVVFGDICAA